MRLIDFHTHVFHPEVIKQRDVLANKDDRFALLYRDKRSRMIDGGMLIKYVAQEGIDVCTVMGFPFKDHGLITMSNDYILRLSLMDKRVIPVIMIDINDEAYAIEEIERCIKGGARGIGEIAIYEGHLGKEGFKRLSAIAGLIERHHMFLILHINEQIGHKYPGKASINLKELTRFVYAHPHLYLILAHLGGGLCFYEFMPEIREAFKNVYYDTAAIPYIYSPDISLFLGMFLDKKVVFGSDYPLIPPSRYINGLKGLKREVKEHILYRNALLLLEGLRDGGLGQKV